MDISLPPQLGIIAGNLRRKTGRLRVHFGISETRSRPARRSRGAAWTYLNPETEDTIHDLTGWLQSVPMRNHRAKAVKVGEIAHLRAIRDRLAKGAPVDVAITERHAADYCIRTVAGMLQIVGARVMSPAQIQRCRIVSCAVGAFAGLAHAGHSPRLGLSPTGLVIDYGGGAIQFDVNGDDHEGIGQEVLQALAAEGVYLQQSEIETEATEDN